MLPMQQSDSTAMQHRQVALATLGLSCWSNLLVHRANVSRLTSFYNC